MAEQLQPREREVLEGLACGLTQREIAADLNLSVATIARSAAHLFQQLGGACTPAHAVAIAYQRGLLTIDESPDVQG